MTQVPILRADWDRLRAAYPGIDDHPLCRRALERGDEVLASDPSEPARDGDPTVEQVRQLRSFVARRAASLAVYRHELVAHRERLPRAEAAERASYERHLELEKDLVPPLKLRAKALRAEIRRLEAQARHLGLDPEAIAPRIDWPETLAVDGYEQPRYETNEQRKRTAVEFFRRLR
jgi:hypothetical protein